MISVILPSSGKEVKVWFQHSNPPESGKGRMDEQALEGCRFTRCVIYDSKQTIIGEGYAQAHPNDNYDKHLGRCLSFARAMSDAEVKRGIADYDVEVLVWAYNEQHRLPFMFGEEAVALAKKILREAEEKVAYLSKYAGVMANA